MLVAWLAKLSKRSSRQARSSRPGRRGKARVFRPWLERLEDLTLLSVTNNWTGAGNDGLWKDANNWSLGLPVPGQDIVITNANNTTSVTLDNSLGAVTIDSLTTSVNFNLTTGAVLLTTGGGSVSAGGVTLQSGAGFAIQGGSTLVINGGAQSITGSGTVTFDTNTNNRLDLNGSCTLTFGSGITVTGENGVIGDSFSASGTQTIVNNGVIDAVGPGHILTLGSVNDSVDITLTNTNGTLEATDTGTLALFSVTVAGGTISTDSGEASEVVQETTTIQGSTITGELTPFDGTINVLSGVTIGPAGVLNISSGRPHLGRWPPFPWQCRE
jgi:hypothetical protein